jgi:hypothetical protein
VFGKQNNTDAINLSAIATGTGGFVINGESEGDSSGWSVSSAGDVNGDGLDDLIPPSTRARLPVPVCSKAVILLALMIIVSSPTPALKTSIPSGKSNAGKSYVIFGKTDTDAVDLSKLGDESKYTIDYLG